MSAKLLGTYFVSGIPVSRRPMLWLPMGAAKSETRCHRSIAFHFSNIYRTGQIAQILGCKLGLRSHSYAPQTPSTRICRRSGPLPPTLDSTRGGFSVARFRSSMLTFAPTSARMQSRCSAVFSKFGGFCRVTVPRADMVFFLCRHRLGCPDLPGSEHHPRAAVHHIATSTAIGPTNPRTFLVFSCRLWEHMRTTFRWSSTGPCFSPVRIARFARLKTTCLSHTTSPSLWVRPSPLNRFKHFPRRLGMLPESKLRSRTGVRYWDCVAPICADITRSCHASLPF